MTLSLSYPENQILRYINDSRINNCQSPSISEVYEYAELVCDSVQQATEIVNRMIEKDNLKVWKSGDCTIGKTY